MGLEYNGKSAEADISKSLTKTGGVIDHDGLTAALVGFPDAGKSTLFNALTGREDSRKMPRFDRIRGAEGEITLADLGGITPWAQADKNPGAVWLAYAEKARLLVFVLALRCGRAWPERCGRDLAFLREAASCYNPAFTGRAHLVVLNCFPGVGPGAEADALDFLCRTNEETAFEKRGGHTARACALCVCAANGKGMPELVQAVSRCLR